jgi:uncharacterized protein YbbK (DUF523 family)/uncharacterized protein YbgA (DUF1722 family)
MSSTQATIPSDKPRIGVSACLLGDEVRFDGGHKRDAFLTDILAPHVEFVRVCPEVEVGMGTPRETLRLVRNRARRVRMITTRTQIDHTDAMIEWARRRLRQLAAERLSGYILKKDSPSCGMEHVKVFNGAGLAHRNGRGIFAEALMTAYPALPVEEEGRLADPVLRENFIERIFAYQRLLAFFGGRWTRVSLVAFHAAHKMSLLAHSATAYSELGRRVAAAGSTPREVVRKQYETRFMRALSIVSTTRRHTKVLMHMAGYLEKVLPVAAREELRLCIETYSHGLVPLLVPLTLVRHHARAHQVTYLAGQTYLEPHPRELVLRNHV